MALSPWHVASQLSEYEVAALLGGYGFAALEVDYAKDHELCEIDQWVVVIVDAAKANELKPELVIMRADVQTGTSDEGYPHFEECWEECIGDEWLDVDHKYIHMTFKRQEIYRWLKASGVTDEDIPEALHITPEPKEPKAPAKQQDPPIHHRRKQTYLKLIEALALEAMGEIPAEPYKAAGVVQAILERHGLPLNKEPIAETIKEIHEAREERDP